MPGVRPPGCALVIQDLGAIEHSDGVAREVVTRPDADVYTEWDLPIVDAYGRVVFSPVNSLHHIPTTITANVGPMKF